MAWNGREETLSCLASLKASRDPTRVIVVDNASTDGTPDAVRAEHPEVEVIANAENRGFAGGNNVGFRRAIELGAQFVLVLNNDTVVNETTIPKLLEALESRPDVAAACPLIYFEDPPNLVWYGGATFNAARGRSGRVTGYRKPIHDVPGPVREVDRGAGAAMLVRTSVLQEVGFFDESLFLYFEDVEWSLRARRAGHRILFVPEAKVGHRVSLAAGGEHSPLILYYETRNHLEVCRRHAPLGRAASSRRAAMVIAVHLRQALRSTARWSAIKATVAGWRDYRRRRFGPRDDRSPR